MLKIKIISPGKVKDAWLDEALAEYVKRLTPVAAFELIWTKDDKQLVKLSKEIPLLICLDPKGKMMSSETFADYFFSRIEKGGSQIAFAIGGPDGFPESMKEGRELLSLSPMTFTHQMARLLLLEQIFRAFEIKRGSAYHR